MSWNGSLTSNESYATLLDVTALKSASRKKLEIPILQMKEEDLDEDSRDTDNRLTSFVREYYLEHLKKRLVKNVDSCLSEEAFALCKEDVERCAVQMEYKALRQCMVVRLYQRAITSMVADIKHSTELAQLHKKLKNFVPSCTERSTQTESTFGASQLLGSSSGIISPVVSARNGIAASVDNCRHQMESPRVAATLTDLMDYDSSGGHKEYSASISALRSPENLPMEQTVNLTKTPTDSVITPTFAKQSNTRTLTADPDLDSKMLTLDQRLAAIHGECYLDDSTDLKEKRKTRKKIVWCYEKLHRYKILNARLSVLSRFKRLKVEHRFVELFGKDFQQGTKSGGEDKGIVDDPLAAYKERIAPWVVKYLMPHYTSKKIKSRSLFKHTAKYITDNLIEKKFLPDEKDVHDSVERLCRN